MTTLHRCLRVWWACLIQAVRRDLQFRSQTLTTALTAILDVALSALPVWLMVRTDHANGWTAASSTLLIGLFNISAALLDTFLNPNVERLSQSVRTGQLDLLLIRPVPTPWLVMTRWIRPANLTRAITGTALIALAGSTMSPAAINPAHLAAAAGWFLAGLLAWALFATNLSWLAFWLTGTDPITSILGSLRDAGQYPASYFTPAAKTVFTVIVPALILANVPLQTLQAAPAPHPLAAAATLLAGLGLTRWHWATAIKRYESASS